MANKILIFGATGAVGSSLAKLMQNGSTECHLIGKNQDEVSRLSDETGHSFSVADVLEEGFLDKIDSDLADTEIKGIAYCVGSIDLKPINLISKKDVMKSFSLNLFPIYDIIKKFHQSLKNNKGSIVLFSTVAANQGFPNHGIISPVKASLEGLTISLAAEFLQT
jgi:Short-chain dehydrogenases of various substrate specificities